MISFCSRFAVASSAALPNWSISSVDNGRMATSEDIAMGYRLAQNYQKMGDYDSMMKVLGDVASLESEAGRTLQAMRMFSHLTPEAKAINIGKQIGRLERATGTCLKSFAPASTRCMESDTGNLDAES